jgi:hypothetical protein
MSGLKIGDRVAVTKDIDGTGIKKGQKGKIIYIQDGYRSLDRFTTLERNALQVRFKGGSEIWFKSDELVHASGPDPDQQIEAIEKSIAKALRRTRKRTEAIDISFRDNLAEGWVFDVPEAFRFQLDILNLQCIDKERTRELRKSRPRDSDGKPATVYRMAWSRSVIPVLRFDAGQVFYDPPSSRGLNWGKALKVLRQIVRVKAARPDEESGAAGWVKFELCRYTDGKAAPAEEHKVSQAAFVTFLRTGLLPAEAGDASEAVREPC